MPVSNSSPLIHLAQLGKLGYARQLFLSVLIPPAVREETIEAGKLDGYPDALILEKSERDGWLRTSELSRQSAKLASELAGVVGKGEAEAIALAVEKSDRLFMDDLKGRRTADFYRIESTTTLGLIFELLATRTISKIDYVKNVKEYGSSGWVSGDVIEQFIERGRDFE